MTKNETEAEIIRRQVLEMDDRAFSEAMQRHAWRTTPTPEQRAAAEARHLRELAERHHIPLPKEPAR